MWIVSVYQLHLLITIIIVFSDYTYCVLKLHKIASIFHFFFQIISTDIKLVK